VSSYRVRRLATLPDASAADRVAGKAVAEPAKAGKQ